MCLGTSNDTENVSRLSEVGVLHEDWSYETQMLKCHILQITETSDWVQPPEDSSKPGEDPLILEIYILASSSGIWFHTAVYFDINLDIPTPTLEIFLNSCIWFVMVFMCINDPDQDEYLWL